jgi:hypothetical protein
MQYLYSARTYMEESLPGSLRGSVKPGQGFRVEGHRLLNDTFVTAGLRAGGLQSLALSGRPLSRHHAVWQRPSPSPL